MAQVSVSIAGRQYRMACNDGEEEHLTELAARLDGKIEELRGTFGPIGDGRITVMAAITMADELSEAERRIAALKEEVDRLRGDQASVDARLAAMTETIAQTIDTAAGRIERIAHGLNAPSRE